MRNDRRTTIYDDDDDNIGFAHGLTVYVGLAQARPKYIWIAHGCTVYVGLAQARPNYIVVRRSYLLRIAVYVCLEKCAIIIIAQ